MTRHRPRVAVIIAATNRRPIFLDSLRRFAAEVRGRGVVVLVDGTEAGIPPPMIDDLLVVRGAPRALVPELWRDGLCDHVCSSRSRRLRWNP